MHYLYRRMHHAFLCIYDFPWESWYFQFERRLFFSILNLAFLYLTLKYGLCNFMWVLLMWFSQIHISKSTWFFFSILISLNPRYGTPLLSNQINQWFTRFSVCYLPSHSRISRSLGDVTIKVDGQSSAPATFEHGGGLYSATPAVTQGIGFGGLIRRTITLSLPFTTIKRY